MMTVQPHDATRRRLPFGSSSLASLPATVTRSTNSSAGTGQGEGVQACLNRKRDHKASHLATCYVRLVPGLPFMA